MARHGGRTTRCVAALGAVAAAALLATAGAVLPAGQPRLASVGADAVLTDAGATDAGATSSGTVAPRTTPPTRGTPPPATGPGTGAATSSDISTSGTSTSDKLTSGTSTPAGEGRTSVAGPDPRSDPTALGAGAPGSTSGGAAAGAPASDRGLPTATTPATTPAGTPAVVTRTAPRTPQEIAPAATPYVPFVSFIGDSWTDGNGATGKRSYAVLTGEQLGWEDRVLGVGGSGYVVGGHGNVPFDERITPALAGNPDVVVIQGSINERNTPTAQLAPAVADTLGRLRVAAGPDTVVLVLGASHVPGLPATVVDRVNDIVRSAAGRLGLRFVDVAAQNWTDPADPAIWADLYHPNDRGYQLVADRLVPLLRAVVGG